MPTESRQNTQPRIGVIGIPGAWSSEILAEHLRKRGKLAKVIPLSELFFDLERNQVTHQGEDLSDYQAFVIKKVSPVYSPASLDRLGLLEWMQHRFQIPFFSAPGEIRRLLNRLDCTLALQSAGIPMPPTCITESAEAAEAFVRRSEAAVAKPLFSTKARGMSVLQANQPDLNTALSDYQKSHPLFYLQKKIPLPGKDLGMMFLGGEYLGCYARNAGSGSWNTTIHDGGFYSAHEPRESTIALAHKAQACFNLDFTTVDIVETGDDTETVIFEVSAFGGFKGAREGLGLDVAKRYVDHLLNKLDRGTSS